MIVVNSLMSIGSHCRTRYQIDRFMEKRCPAFTPGSLVFDYLMMGGVRGVIDMVKRDFRLEEGGIYIHEQAPSRFLPRDKSSGMAFVHDFGHNGWSETLGEAQRKLESAMASTLSKYAYLGEKTKSFLAGSTGICLIYEGHADIETLLELKVVLFEKYRKKFLIANVVENGSPLHINSDWLISVEVDDKNSPKNGTAREWEGWDESWDSALSAIPLVIDSSCLAA